MINNSKPIFRNRYLPKKNNAGFTIIELLVVMGIMTILIGLFTVNLAGQRASRSLKIAQNELVTNLRKFQSYILSGRSIGIGQGVQYYIVKFDKTNSTNASRYTVQALYKDPSGIWKLKDVESDSFPTGVSLSSISISSGGINSTPTCALLAFQVPYGRIFMNPGCNPSPLPSNPYSVISGDDYNKIITFVTNTVTQTVTVNSKMTLNLVFSQDLSQVKQINVNGITGSITGQ